MELQYNQQHSTSMSKTDFLSTQSQDDDNIVTGASKILILDKETISIEGIRKNNKIKNNSNKFLDSPSYFQNIEKDAKKNKDKVVIEIEIIYKEDESTEVDEQDKNIHEDISLVGNKNTPILIPINKINKTQLNKFNSGIFADQIENENEIDPIPLDLYKHSSIIYFPKNRTEGTFIENELKKSGDPSKNYIKIELRVKRNKINLETMLSCFEYFLNKNLEFHYDRENIISYFYAFSICKIEEKRKEVLDRLLLDLSEENIIYFIKAISCLNDDFLNSYCFWLIRHLVNKNEKLEELSYNGYNFASIVKLAHGQITFDKLNKNIVYSNSDKKFSLSANLKFLKGFFNNFYKNEFEKYYKPNDYFNIGKIIRRKSDEKMINDYPHYYQMKLENDPELSFYAIRPGENSSFILSKNIDDFTKYGVNYIGEVVPNFWGTYFEVWDNGYEKGILEKTNKILANQRRLIGAVSYETNLMGECPRYFKLEINENNEQDAKNENNVVHKLENLKPEWNENLECYCLNFYGRVKKASAKNFQIVYPDDPDNIIFQHGKVSKDEFNLDFREPFNYMYAFAVSLAAIGKKRVVS